MNPLMECCKKFDYKYSQPAPFKIERRKDRDVQEWLGLIRNKLAKFKDITFVVFILPGGKGKGQFYNEIK